MNIQDFDKPAKYPRDILADIFARQRELAEKYHPIEAGNGFNVGEGLEVNINDKFGQARIKDFAWRVTEELMEATEAWNEGDIEHCQEEIADALHFMVELCIIVDYSSDNFLFDTLFLLTPDESGFREPVLNTVYNLGLACNCLKNKPWKQTHMLTDEEKFKLHLNGAMSSLVFTAVQAGIGTAEHMYNLYFRKNKVNQFRQESKY